jgi:hypothetical protein
VIRVGFVLTSLGALLAGTELGLGRSGSAAGQSVPPSMAPVPSIVGSQSPAASASPPPATGASVPERTVTIPMSVDPTGERDVSERVQEFVDDVPAGTEIRFQPGATYRLDTGIELASRHELTFDGQGATILSDGCEIPDSAFFLRTDAADITIRNFNLVGENPGGYLEGCESSIGVAMYGSRNVLIEGVHVRNHFGHCWYMDERNGWTDGVVIRDSSCVRAGVMGVAITSGRNILVERTSFEDIALFPFDIEPSEPEAGGEFVVFQDNTIHGYGLAPEYSPWLLAAAPSVGIINNITFTRNTVTKAAPDTNPERDTAAGLTVAMYGDIRKSDIVITDNVSMVPGEGPVMDLANIDRLTITGNIQPLTSGSLADIRNSTEVVLQP